MPSRPRLCRRQRLRRRPRSSVNRGTRSSRRAQFAPADWIKSGSRTCVRDARTQRSRSPDRGVHTSRSPAGNRARVGPDAHRATSAAVGHYSPKVVLVPGMRQRDHSEAASRNGLALRCGLPASPRAQAACQAATRSARVHAREASRTSHDGNDMSPPPAWTERDAAIGSFGGEVGSKRKDAPDSLIGLVEERASMPHEKKACRLPAVLASCDGWSDDETNHPDLNLQRIRAA